MKSNFLSILLCAALLGTAAQADIGVNVQNQKSKSQTNRDSIGLTDQNIESDSKQTNVGTENSNTNTDTVSNTFQKSKSNTITRTKSGGWNITLNPLPYFRKVLNEAQWDKRAFWLSPSDFGIDTYEDDEGVIDNLKAEYLSRAAAGRMRVKSEQLNKISEVVNVLYNTGAILNQARSMLESDNIDMQNVESAARIALERAARSYTPERLRLTDCYYNKDILSFSCNGGAISVVSNTNVPTLFLNGGKWYSEDVIAYKSFIINANFAKSDADALATLMQDSRTKSIAKAIRDFTSKLEQKGLTKQASAIKQRFIEKAMTSNVSENTQAAIQAINSGSPTAVLKVFQ